jgi:hypothetical protein
MSFGSEFDFTARMSDSGAPNSRAPRPDPRAPAEEASREEALKNANPHF